jgi:translation initiation factor IF-1
MDSKEVINNQQNQPLGDAQSSSKKIIKREGRVIEALPNAFFKVVLDDGKEVTGFLSGKMRLNRIKILLGDKVTLEMSEYDMGKGRIVYRLK